MEGGHLMRLPGCSVVISTRLRNALREYSKRHGITLLEALEKLREEVHQGG